MPHDNVFKIYLKFARVLRRLFLSVVSVTRAVYFHVNVTCFAAKHLKFDSHYSRFSTYVTSISYLLGGHVGVQLAH